MSPGGDAPMPATFRLLSSSLQAERLLHESGTSAGLVARRLLFLRYYVKLLVCRHGFDSEKDIENGAAYVCKLFERKFAVFRDGVFLEYIFKFLKFLLLVVPNHCAET